MSRFLALLIRFFAISAGYAAAALAASAFSNGIMFGAAGYGFAGQNDLETVGFYVSVGLGALFIGYFAFLPAMAAIVIAEIMRKRDWLFFALGGAAVSAVALGLFRGTGGEAENDTALISLALASGIIGGLVYWLVAGRGSGGWMRSRPSPDPDHPPRNSSSIGG